MTNAEYRMMRTISQNSKFNIHHYDFRCLLQRGPPLPIPNREVKPVSADGTALLRVGE